jgi:DNA-directed RNA polymerase subunit RPC12/RpoP
MDKKVDVQCPNCERDFAQDASDIESYKLMKCPRCREQFYYFPESLRECLDELEQALKE